MNSATPKVFLSLKGTPLIVHTLVRFLAAQTIGRVILVIPEREMTRCDALIRTDRRLDGLDYTLQAGGPRRQDSVSRGLACLDQDCEVAVIHDGARPFVPPLLLDRCVEVARKEGAVVAGLPARETIKMVSTEKVVYKTLPRECLWQIQTPQAFQAELIRAAYKRAEQEHTEATDDAMLVELLGKRVVVVEGDPLNIKVTVPEDLLFAEMLVQKQFRLDPAVT